VQYRAALCVKQIVGKGYAMRGGRSLMADIYIIVASDGKKARIVKI
jgi:hypothetical protein